MRSALCALLSVGVISANATLGVAQTAGAYREPAYVLALLGGKAEQLASPNPLPWNTEIAAWKRANASLPDEAVDEVLRAQNAGTAPGTADGEAAVRAWAERASKELESTYIRRPIFRYHYIIAFAQKLNTRCKFLQPDHEGEVAAGIRAAIKTFHIGERTKEQIDAIPQDDKLALKYMHETIFNAQSDADTFAKATTCTSSNMNAVRTTLLRLLSPLQPSSAADDKKREARERDAMKGQADDFILGETYVRTGDVQRGPYATAFQSVKPSATLRVPAVDEQVARKTVGWFTDVSVFEAAKADGKPILIVLTQPSADCPLCRAFMQDLLSSKPFNALSGHFHAVLLVANSDPNSLFNIIRLAFDGNEIPGVYLFRVGGEGKSSTLLFKRTFVTSAGRISRELEPLLGTVAQPSVAAGGHTGLVARPGICWAIETFDMCRERERRSMHAE